MNKRELNRYIFGNYNVSCMIEICVTGSNVQIVNKYLIRRNNPETFCTTHYMDNRSAVVNNEFNIDTSKILYPMFRYTHKINISDYAGQIIVRSKLDHCEKIPNYKENKLILSKKISYDQGISFPRVEGKGYFISVILTTTEKVPIIHIFSIDKFVNELEITKAMENKTPVIGLEYLLGDKTNVDKLMKLGNTNLDTPLTYLSSKITEVQKHKTQTINNFNKGE